MFRPFISLAVSTILGVLLAHYFTLPMSMIFIWIFISFSILIYKILKNYSADIWILLIFLLLGALRGEMAEQSILKNFIGIRKEYIGIVEEVLKEEDGFSKYVVRVKTAEDVQIDEDMSLTIIGEKRLNIGEHISFYGVLKLPERNTNPKLFNYSLNLLSDDIHTIMSVKDFSVQSLNIKIPFQHSIRDKFSKDIINIFNRFLTTERANFISSIILGKSSILDEDQLIKYRDLGLAHILAVSGLHIGIITGFMMFVFSRTGLNPKLNVILSLYIIWIYNYLIGFPPSTVRASLMFSALCISRLVHEPYDSLNIIMGSMLLSILLNPYWIFSVGFQLSYGATISVVLLNGRVRDLFYPYKGKLVDSISTILAVNIGLLPIQGYYFNRLPMIGLLANLVTIPIISIVLVIGIIMVFLNYTLYFLNDIFGYLLNLILSVEEIIVEVLYGMDFNLVRMASPGLYDIILYYILVTIFFKIIKIEKLKIEIQKTIIFYVAFLILFNSAVLLSNDGVYIEFIDVGQGDSILIRTGASTYLMDTGGSLMDSFDVGRFITLPYLEKQGVRELDGIIITHFDEDHYKGIDALFGEIKIKNIYSGYMPEKQDFLSNIEKHNIPFKIIGEGDKIVLDRNTSLNIIYPGYMAERLSSNNKSIVSVLEHKGTKILFTGDIEIEAEYNLSDKLQQVHMLKVAHHGSRTSTTEEFLERANPSYAVISVGRNNPYSHPSGEVIDRLESKNIHIYRTDEVGRIKVHLKDEKIDITGFLDSWDYNMTLTGYLYDNIYLFFSWFVFLLISINFTRKYIKGETQIYEL